MTAVDARASNGLDSGWQHLLGPVDQIPIGEGRTFTVDELQIVVFRLRDGSLRALDAVCPHRGGPLADGQTDARVVVCPLHQHTFDLSSGQCLTGAPDTRTYSAYVDVDGAIVLHS